jgi:hypothetical protein
MPEAVYAQAAQLSSDKGRDGGWVAVVHLGQLTHWLACQLGQFQKLGPAGDRGLFDFVRSAPITFWEVLDAVPPYRATIDKLDRLFRGRGDVEP